MQTVRYEVGDVVVEARVPVGVVLDIDVWVHLTHNSEVVVQGFLAALEPGMDAEHTTVDDDSVIYRLRGARRGERCDFYVFLPSSEAPPKSPPHPVGVALLDRLRDREG